MPRRIPSALHTLLLLHALIGALVGVQHLLAPHAWSLLTGVPLTEPAVYRILGAALIGFASASWMAWHQPVWERVRIVVVMHVVWTSLGALAMVWGILREGLPTVEWLNVGILVFFAAAFAYHLGRTSVTEQPPPA